MFFPLRIVSVKHTKELSIYPGNLSDFTRSGQKMHTILGGKRVQWMQISGHQNP